MNRFKRAFYLIFFPKKVNNKEWIQKLSRSIAEKIYHEIQLRKLSYVNNEYSMADLVLDIKHQISHVETYGFGDENE